MLKNKRKTNTTPDFFKQGKEHYDKNEYNAAIETFTKAIEQKPNFVEAFINRGLAYNNKGDYDGAIADFTEAVRLEPNYAEVFFNRGSAYHGKGEYDKAIADYTEAVQLQLEDNSDAIYDRGLAYGKKGEYDKAIADFDLVIRLHPNYAAPFFNRGIAYGRKGDYDKAIADYGEAIRLKPGYAKAFDNRGVAYENKGEQDKATADYNEARRLKQNSAEISNPQAPQTTPETLAAEKVRQDFRGSTFVYNFSGNSNSQIIVDSPYAQINITANEENAVLEYLKELADNNKNNTALQKILQETQTAVKEKKSSEGFLRGIGSALKSLSISLASNLLTPIVKGLLGI